ncbi:MAG: nitrate transporter ATP-binding protein, partial [Rhodospirillales bacterium]|nr:nitrate transporter ATP-binding protein [Rhodospirillales bacterium]
MQPKISVAGVRKTFDSDAGPVEALGGVNLDVAEGEFASIVGPSGCGKSTLLYMLGGFVPASEGRLATDEKPITGPGVDRGIVFQEYALFPWLTVYDNIAYGLRRQRLPAGEIRSRVERYVALIGLAGFENRFPR